MRAILLAATAAMTLGACATRTVSVHEQGPTSDAVAPTLLVERFLRAANVDDVDTMGRIFGTVEGPIIERDPAANVNRRMLALAAMLRHREYVIVGSRPVPGRSGEAEQIVTRLRQGNRVVEVPFTLVRTRDGSWLVESFGTEEMGRR